MSRNAARISVSGFLSLAVILVLTLTVLPRNNNRQGRSVTKDHQQSQALSREGVGSTRPDHNSMGDLATLGSAPQIPNSAQRLGKLDAKHELSLRIVLRPRHEAELNNLVTAISTPSSPQYRQPISSAEFKQRFSPSQSSIHALSQQLGSAGLAVKPAAHSSLMLAISGSADEVGKFLHSPFSSYRFKGQLGYAIDRAPRLSGNLGKSVAGLVGLSNLLPRIHHGITTKPSDTQQSHTLSSNATGPAACGAVNAISSPSGPYTGNQLAHAYGLDAAYAADHLGTGQTVAMYELAPYAPSDIRSYTTCYGINPVISKVNVDGGAIGAVSAEPTLDIQMFASLAPSAAIKVYQGPNDAVGPIDVFAQIASDNIADVVSVSWGACEAANGTASADAENVIFTQMAAQGQTVLAASGDSGSSDCYAMNGDPALSVDDPASQPLVTGVGGTTMTSVGPPPTERVWNDQDPFAGGAGGGGISNTWTRPAWQWGPGTGSESMRQVPDISAAADPSYDMIMYMASYGGWIQIGGTSAASPLLSAAIALTNESCATRVGLINPVLYALAASSATALNDITRGNNDLLGIGSFSATAGYDPASGLGTPSASFIENLCLANGSVSLSDAHTGMTADYSIDYTNGNALLDTGTSLSLSGPGGTVWPSDSSSYTVAVNGGSPQQPSAIVRSSGIGSLSLNIVSLTLSSPIPAGAAVSIVANGTTNPATAGSQAIIVTDSSDDVPVLNTYSLIASVPSAARSSIVVDQSSALADGISAITVTVTVANAGGTVIAGQALSLTLVKPTSAVVTPSPALADQNGVAIFTITDTRAQSTTGSIRSAGVTLGSTGPLIFRSAWSASFQSTKSAVAGSPNVAVPPIASGVNIAAVSRNAQGHLILLTDSGASYTKRDLTVLTGGNAVIGSNPAAATVGNALVVVGRSSANHLLVFSSSNLTSWSLVDLSSKVGKNVSGDPVVLPTDSTIAVFARGSNSHILRFSNDAVGVVSWQVADLTALSGTKLVATNNLAVAIAGSHEVIVARSSKSHLMALTNSAVGSRLWSATDLNSASAGALPTPNVKLSPSIAVGPGPDPTIYVAAITNAGAMLVIANNGSLAKSWVATDYSASSNLAASTTEITAVVQGSFLRLFSRSASGHLLETLSGLDLAPTTSGVDLSTQFGLPFFAAGPSAAIGLNGKLYIEGRTSTNQLVAYLRST